MYKTAELIKMRYMFSNIIITVLALIRFIFVPFLLNFCFLHLLSFSFIGLPLEGIALLMTADFIMDMARTTTNVIGNALATVAERGTTID
ncbi:hypothetical protein BA70_03645 [Bacillus zhangzhouensis]|uniref:Uncharacterized protein n=2 Tax=Bacillus zhangzhouensis TaxID=1178540 RepID=A0A081LA40_9BACI|nr:hypothetical protein BA70_03645 [Bacillus zhangzhouensis]